MIEPDDKVTGRYRQLAREEPPPALDERILAAARAGSRSAPTRWMGPVSIAAVLVLGIGVSLRMQLEKPGIETSVPSSSSAEYPVTQSEPPQAPARADTTIAAQPVAPPTAAPAVPEAAPPAKSREAEATTPPKVLRKERAAAKAPVEEAHRNVARDPAPSPFTDAPVTMQAPVPVSPPASASAPAAAPAPPAGLASPPPAAAAAPAPSVAPAQAMPRAKREGLAADSASGARELRRAAAEPDPDPLRELERIAGLRSAGNHVDADRALEQFRRRHPDFRIPEALWERVRPR